MNQKEANRFVIDTLSPTLKTDGYKYVSWGYSFHSKKDDFRYSIGWKNVNRITEFEIGYHIAIRSERVTEIYNMFSGIDEKYRRHTATLILPFAYFRGEQINLNTQIILSDSSSHKDVLDSFLPTYKDKIKPFVNEYSSLEKLSSFINHNTEEVYGDTHSNFMIGAILLKLINSPDYTVKIQDYKKKLLKFTTWEQDIFNRLTDYLNTI